MHAIIEQVKEGEMPLNSYLWIHKDAVLNEVQKTTIINWAQQIMDSVAQKNNLPPIKARKE